MFRRLYRQRRRLALFAVLIAAAFTLMWQYTPELRLFFKHEMQGPNWIRFASLGIAVFLVFGAIAVLVISLAPGLRRGLEVGAFAYLIMECLRIVDPVLPLGLSVEAHYWFGFFLTYIVVELALAHDVGRKWGLRLPLRAAAERIVRAAPDAIWAALIPETGAADRHWVEGLVEVKDRPDLGPNVREARYRLGPYGMLVQRQDRRVDARPYHGVYDFEPNDDGPRRSGQSGTFELHCEGIAPGKCKVRITHTYEDVGLGTWLLLVLDDFVASELDGVVAHLTERRDWSIAGWQARKLARV
ncbi:hypothetical protein [Gymnodinialimonas hymeniacidonis]|uniref:hypothetical protein n=1 Tax=Gymnodinialimonas hymeniacidonis TaxID=3126508 RepID=UPI0034C5F3F2